MVFEKFISIEFYWSNQKQAAYKRKQSKELEKAGLFAEEVKRDQLSIDEEKERRINHLQQTQLDARHTQAAWWKKARKSYFSLDGPVKQNVKTHFESKWIPKQPWYLLDIIKSEKEKALYGHTIMIVTIEQNTPTQLGLTL